MSLRVKALWAIMVFCVAAGTYWAQEKQEKKGEAQGSGASSSTAATPSSPHNFEISPEEAARKNPVRFTDVSVERGKKVYMTQCAICHGDKGDGKGDLATEMKLNLPDFTKPDALAQRTDGELFVIVTTGKDPMPSQKGRMTDTHLWNVVNYLRALGGKVPAKATAKESADENIILVPQ
jgi:mono/diheme cytochrome c family protein